MIFIYNDISFPKLNISVTINPIALNLGFLKIYWYGIILAIGFLSAFIYINKNLKRFKIKSSDFLDMVLYGVIFGIIGARLYYVIFYPGDYYIKNPWKILDITNGGIAIYGGIIGGLIGASVIAKRRNLKILPILDAASLGFLIGQSIGRWGNFVNQEAFGVYTDLPWGMMSQRTGYQTVHPCFLYESLWCLIGFLILHIYSRKSEKRKDGYIFYLYMIWYGMGRFFIEGIRTDSLIVPYLGIRVSQVFSLAIVVMSCVLLGIKSYKHRKNT